jgi:hypothetical protein
MRPFVPLIPGTWGTNEQSGHQTLQLTKDCQTFGTDEKAFSKESYGVKGQFPSVYVVRITHTPKLAKGA